MELLILLAERDGAVVTRQDFHIHRAHHIDVGKTTPRSSVIRLYLDRFFEVFPTLCAIVKKIGLPRAY